MNREITMGSLFDGIAGFPFAAEKFRIKTIWASEIETFAIAVSKQQFPDMKHLGDIKKLNGKEIPPVDIITGGSPCQDLSIAGLRKGLSGSRSSLFLEQVRIVKEMRKHDIKSGRTGKEIRPRFMVWENVPGAFSSAKGKDFRKVLEEICRVKNETIVIPKPKGDKWTTAGCIMGKDFSIAWRVLDAQYWGVPQRRKRIFLIADFGGQSAPQILFEPYCLSGNIEESKGKREKTAECFGESTSKSISKKVNILPFDTSFMVSPQSHSVPKFGDACHTFGASSHVPKVIIENCYCIVGNTICRKPENGGNGTEIKKNTSYTLNTIDRHAVYYVNGRHDNDEIFNEHTYHYWKKSDVGSTLKLSGGFCGGGSENLSVSKNGVRKLTPLECERLQGFPDGWTSLSDKGDFSNEDFAFWKSIYTIRRSTKKEPTKQQVLNWYNKLCSDSARYRALGNSIAIPCVEFVMKRIKNIMYYDGGGI